VCVIEKPLQSWGLAHWGSVVLWKIVWLWESYETRYIYLPYETRYIYLPYETRYIYLPYETRYIYLPYKTRYIYLPYKTRYIYLPYETRYIHLPYKTRYIYLPYETRFIYLPEGHKLLKHYLHEVSPFWQPYSDITHNKFRPPILSPQLPYPRYCSRNATVTALTAHFFTYCTEQSPYWDANRFLGSEEIHQFMEPESTLPDFQVPANCPYPEPARSNPYPHISHFLKILVLSFHLRLVHPSGLLFLGFPHQNSVYASPLIPYALHAPPISFFLIWLPERQWVNSTDH